MGYSGACYLAAPMGVFGNTRSRRAGGGGGTHTAASMLWAGGATVDRVSASENSSRTVLGAPPQSFARRSATVSPPASPKISGRLGKTRSGSQPGEPRHGGLMMSVDAEALTLRPVPVGTAATGKRTETERDGRDRGAGVPLLGRTDRPHRRSQHDGWRSPS